MFCRNCNKENSESASFCRNCGAPLRQPDERTQSAEQGFKGQHVQNINPYPQQARQGGSINIKIFIIAAAAIVAAVLGIFTVFVLSSVNKDDGDTPVTATQAASTAGKKGGEDVDKNNEAETAYKNITCDGNVVSDNELSSLQKLLESKTVSFKNNIHLCVLKSADDGAQKYADANREKLAGSDGVLIVLDDKTKKAGISAGGKSKSFITDTVKNKLIDNNASTISSGEYSDGLQAIITSIPESSEEVKAVSFEPVTDSDQVVYVKKNSGSNKAKLTVVDFKEKRPAVKLECDAYVGSDGITDSPSEKKSATPKGANKLGMVLTTNTVSTEMVIEPVNPNDVWVTDPDSAFYNTKQPGPANRPGLWTSADNIYNNFDSGKFYACILIEHNGDGHSRGAYNKGSGIYITGKSSDLSKSWGDVNISVSDMKKLLGILDAQKNPYIVVS